MPRPDLRLIDGGAGYATLTRKLVHLASRTCLIEVMADPPLRRWVPTSCIVSQAPAVGEDVTVRVPLALAIREGLVKRAEVQLDGCPARVLAAIRPGDKIDLSVPAT